VFLLHHINCNLLSEIFGSFEALGICQVTSMGILCLSGMTAKWQLWTLITHHVIDTVDGDKWFQQSKELLPRELMLTPLQTTMTTTRRVIIPALANKAWSKNPVLWEDFFWIPVNAWSGAGWSDGGISNKIVFERGYEAVCWWQCCW
jgi:uncharacterized membrane protein